MLFCLLATPSYAQEFRILTEEYPPYNYERDGKIVGISTEITREMLKRLGHPDNIRLMPWSQAYNLVLNEDNLILYSTTRITFREKLFKWVGPLVPNNTVLFARKGSGIALNSLEDAKKVRSIGIYKDDSGELMLKGRGFTNLVSVLDNRENLTRLAQGKIDLWIINELTGKHMARQAGLADQIVKVLDVQKEYMYLAFSKTTPDEVIDKWQGVLDEIKSDGTYGQIFSKWLMFSYSDDLKPISAQPISLSEQERAWIKQHPIIRVAPDPDYAPFQFTDKNGKSQGLANEYLALMGKKLGIKFKLVPSPSWSASLEAVKKRSADLVAVAAKTPGRKKYLSFTSPYVSFPDVLITRKNSPRVSSLSQLRGRSLGSIKGFAINTYIQEQYPDIKLTYKPDVASLLNSLSMGELDVVVINVATASYAIEKANITNLRIDAETGFLYELAFASRNDWPMLNQLLEKALKSINQSERKNLLRKWISISYSIAKPPKNSGTVELTAQERAWLKEHPVITAAPDPNWEPVEFFDKEGKYSGMSADYLALMEKRLGIKIKILQLSSWEEILQKVLNGQVDVATCIAKTPNRMRRLLFTEPYLTLPSVIVVNDKESGRIGLDNLKGKVVAILSGDASQEFMEREHPEIHLDLVSTYQEGLRKVSFGNAYAFIGSVATVSYFIEKEVILNLRVAGEVGFFLNLGFGSHRGEPILHQILAKGLASISKEERRKIFSRWILISKETWTPSREQIISLLVSLGILFIIAIVVWNRTLAKRVEQRTIELNQALRTSENLRQKADMAQQEAEQANKAKSEFLASMSHEIRTPMNAIIGMADLIGRTQLSKEQKEYVGIFQNAGENLLNIINDILDISKVESGRLTLESVPFDLNQLIEEVADLMANKAHKRGLELNYIIQEETSTLLLGDSKRLQQILINLVGNAVKFTQSGEIIIRVEPEPEKAGSQMLRFSISDTGIGVPPDKADLIFESFTQADSSTTRKFGGTGLGLAICKKLVTKMGGKIWVEPNPAGGSIFCFTIKAALQADQQAGARSVGQISNPLASPIKAGHASTPSLNILLVDDDPVNLKVATMMLEMQQHKVTAVTDGGKAIEAYKTSEFDLIFMDVNMQEMDGYQTTKLIRDIEVGSGVRVPIVALTALVFKEDKQKCLDAGMDGYVSKPFTSDKLAEAINRFYHGPGLPADVQKQGPASQAKNADEVLDKAGALAKASNDWDSLEMLADIYFEHSKEQLAKLEAAIQEGNTVEIGKLAHSLRGSLSALGAVAAAASAAELEHAGSGGDFERLHHALRNDMAEFDSALKNFIKEKQI